MKTIFGKKFSLFQLLSFPKPEKMFSKNYPFYTSSSKFMINHFEKYSKWLKKLLKKKNFIICELGSNDGTFLKNFNQNYSIGVEPDFLKTNDGKQPPVVHVDSTAPLYSDKTKKLLTDKIWGIYYKPDIDGLGVQGGTSPYIVKKHFDQVNVDPYGIESPEYQTDRKSVV